MFDNFYDKAKHETWKEKDKFGNEGYTSSTEINVRRVGGSDRTQIGTDETSIKYDRKYHVPKEVKIKNNDKLDGKLVVDVKPSRGVTGTLHFWIVKVI